MFSQPIVLQRVQVPGISNPSNHLRMATSLSESEFRGQGCLLHNWTELLRSSQKLISNFIILLRFSPLLLSQSILRHTNKRINWPKRRQTKAAAFPERRLSKRGFLIATHFRCHCRCYFERLRFPLSPARETRGPGMSRETQRIVVITMCHRVAKW